jgi:hypothetical protein
MQNNLFFDLQIPLFHVPFFMEEGFLKRRICLQQQIHCIMSHR